MKRTLQDAALIIIVIVLGTWAVNIVRAQQKDEHMKGPSVELQTRMLKVQLASQKIITEYQACQARPWQQEASKQNAALQTLIDQAFAEAKLDKKDWDINMDTFEFVKKVSNSPDAPPPAAKKPEGKP